MTVPATQSCSTTHLLSHQSLTDRPATLLQYALGKGDVYFVTMRQLIDWMKV